MGCGCNKGGNKNQPNRVPRFITNDDARNARLNALGGGIPTNPTPNPSAGFISESPTSQHIRKTMWQKARMDAIKKNLGR